MTSTINCTKIFPVFNPASLDEIPLLAMKRTSKVPMGGVIFFIFVVFTLGYAQGSYRLQRDGFTTTGGYLTSSQFQTDIQIGKNDFGPMQSQSYRMGGWVAVQISEERLSTDFQLEQNYPNPFNQSTQLRWRVAQTTTVEIAVYSLRGQRVATLLIGRQLPGLYQLQYNGTDDAGRLLPSGIYFCRLNADTYQRVIKFLIVR